MAEEKKNRLDIFLKGFIKENPTFVMLLGLCPTLGTTTSAINGMGMGLATAFVLTMSNLVISLAAPYIPDKVRIPSYIVIIASFVTMVDMTMHAYAPELYKALGIFIPLIVVNCIILGRAEAFASKNGPWDSILDGLGVGLGFTMSLTILGAVREILGSGKVFGLNLHIYHGDGILVFILAPGAFLVLAYLIAIGQRIKKRIYGE